MNKEGKESGKKRAQAEEDLHVNEEGGGRLQAQTCCLLQITQGLNIMNRKNAVPVAALGISRIF